MHNDTPLVSVICTNYNKGSWIGEAVESFLKQETSFKYEILLIDDASTDESKNIIKEYSKRYPDKIRAFYNKNNLGITKTWIKICKEARGKYIARCDGDDYWIDNKKLQKQVDLLEKSKDSKWCSTDYDVVNANGETTHKSAIETGFINKPSTYAEMLATKGMTMASTWLVDTKLMQDINNDIDNNAVDDTFNIQLELFHKTKLSYISDSTTIYRMIENSDSRPDDPAKVHARNEKLLDSQLEYIHKYDGFQYKDIIGLLLRQSVDYADRFEIIKNQSQQIKVLNNQIETLNNHIEIFEEEIAQKDSTIHGLLNSKKYRVGKIIAAPVTVANKLKNNISKKDNDSMSNNPDRQHNDNINNRTISYKGLVKNVIKPFMPVITKTVYVNVFGRQVFANHYTRSLPVYGKMLSRLDDFMLIKHVQHIRQQEYSRWFNKNFPKKTALEEQGKAITEFNKKPLISILVPVYNPNINHLRECLESVLAQSYENWQLCLADDASTDPKIKKVIKEFANRDNRIKYVFRDKNGHICKATNSALKIATGDFVALLDNDDYLWPNALYEVVRSINDSPNVDFVYSDEDKIDLDGKTHTEPFFKPDWSPEFLRSINYITHFAVVKRSLVNKVGGFREGYEGAQDWDLFLRISRQTNNIVHIPMILYSWRKSETSTASAPSAKDYAYKNQKKALLDDSRARGLEASIKWQIPYSMWRIDHRLQKEPKVSIVIPTKNQYDFISQCLSSIKKTTYKNFELVVVDTGSDDDKVWKLYDQYKTIFDIKVVKWTKEFNFSGACNLGAEESTGEYLLFLNNDTEVISPDWINSLVGYASQSGVGAVGCKLYYPTGELQHGGIILGVGGNKITPGIAGHFFPAFKENPPQDPAQLLYDGGTRNFAAVTAASIMVSKEKFYEVHGFDIKFKIAFNDVDFCLKLLKNNYRNVYLPHVELFHHESVSVGRMGSKVRDPELFNHEIRMMIKKWGELIKNDPYYHPEFRRDIASARLKV